MIRISTPSFYEQSQTTMNSQRSSLMRVQQQIGSGRKILAPSDDPVGASRGLAVSQSIALSTQYSASRAQATRTLSLEENVLQSVTVLLQNVKVLVVQGGNGTMSDTDRASVATTLQSAYEQLLGLANTADGDGQHLFSGYRSATPPFVRQADGSIQYVGDQGERLLQVDVSRQMAGTDDGRTLFQSVQDAAGYVNSSDAANQGSGIFGPTSVVDPADPNFGKDFQVAFAGGSYAVSTTETPPVVVATGVFASGAPIKFGGLQFTVSGLPADGDVFRVSTAKNAGTDVFDTIADVISALRNPLDNGTDADRAQLANALSTTNRKVSNALDNILSVRASVGSRLVELDALNATAQSGLVQDKSYLSDLQDLDYAKAISEVYQRQSALEASQQVFLKVQQISLFGYL